LNETQGEADWGSQSTINKSTINIAFLPPIASGNARCWRLRGDERLKGTLAGGQDAPALASLQRLIKTV